MAEMVVNFSSYNHADDDDDDDDYIDMEISSYSSTFLRHSKASPSQPRDHQFEFQMSSTLPEKHPTTSPADELFYKGKLLPLHLPPRLQMVENLLDNYYSTRNDAFDEFFSTPLMTTAATPTTTSTPFESCSVSPSESCLVSRELNPDEYFIEYSNVLAGDNVSKKSWIKKLKLIKQSSISSKLKVSRAYFKSLFGKSDNSDDSGAAPPTKVAGEGIISNSREFFNKSEKETKKIQVQKEIIRNETPTTYTNKSKIIEDGNGRLHRRSFSMAIKLHSTTKSSSSTCSSSCDFSSSGATNTNGFYGLPFLKRSNSVNAEVENPIQGAIAHCKQSQQLFCHRKTANEIGCYPLSTSKLATCEDQQRPELCRG